LSVLKCLFIIIIIIIIIIIAIGRQPSDVTGDISYRGEEERTCNLKHAVHKRIANADSTVANTKTNSLQPYQ